MTVEHRPAISPERHRAAPSRCDAKRAAMVLAVAALPLGSAMPAQAAPVQTAPLDTQRTLLPTARGVSSLPTAPVTLPTAPTTVTRYVDVPLGNVRSGPGMSYAVVTSLTKGTRVTGTLTSNGWLKMADGRYMGLSILTTSAPGGTSTTSPSTGNEVTRYVTATNGNVRSGPGMTYRVVGTLSRGTEVKGTISNGWLKMADGRYIGTSILTTTAPGGTSTTSPSTGNEVTRYVTATNGNVRSGPGTSYGVVGTLSRGTQVTGTLTSNGWLNLGGGRYISGVILTSTAPGTATSPTAPSTGAEVTRYVTATAGNVRSGPGTSYGVVGTLPRGTQVNGVLTTSGWLNLGGGRYISSTILSSTDPSAGGLPGGGASAGSVSGAAILAEGEKYFGIMYVWGGEDPSGFDCSGYTQYVFGRLGINLPRTAAQQQQFATPVSNPQPGDLVFWGAPAWHVAIYAGDGYIYDSGRAGLPVQKRKMFSGVTGYGRAH
jgi:peptidoglycan DL-endopeptidase CwlO